MPLIKKDTKINLSPSIKDYSSFFKYIKQKYQIVDKRLVLFKNDIETSIMNTFDKGFNIKHIDIEKCKFEKLEKNQGDYEIEEILGIGEDLVGKDKFKISKWFDKDYYSVLFDKLNVFIFYTLWIGSDNDYNLIYIITDKSYEIYNVTGIEDAIN